LGIAWGVAAFGILGRVFNQWLLKIYLKYRFRKYINEIIGPILANSIMFGFGLILSSFIKPAAVMQTAVATFFCGVLTLLVYGLLCARMFPEECRFVIRHLRLRRG
jgi:hypothetical protein